MQSLHGNLYSHIPAEAERNGAAALVLPGGGYKDNVTTLDYEGTDVAAWMCSLGYAAFTLQYTLEPRSWSGRAAGVEPAIADGLEALSIITSRADELGLHCGAVCIIGFSAGAHLAMCILREIAERGLVQLKPAAMILAYPPARNPLCPCIMGSLIVVPTYVDRILPWTSMLCSSSQHHWCNPAVAAEAMPPTLLVASTKDRLLPPKKHGDVIAAAFRTYGTSLTYLRRDFGWHGFALNGWREECQNWLHDNLIASKAKVRPKEINVQLHGCF